MTSVISLIAFVVFCIGIWGSVDFQEGFQEGFQRGLRRSPAEQFEDGYLDDYGIPDEDEDRYLDDDGFWDEDDRFEDDIMDTF